jgi:hypothetical protein
MTRPLRIAFEKAKVQAGKAIDILPRSLFGSNESESRNTGSLMTEFAIETQAFST